MCGTDCGSLSQQFSALRRLGKEIKRWGAGGGEGITRAHGIQQEALNLRPEDKGQ